MAAHLNLLAAAGVPPGLRDALHMPFYPACATQYYRPRTTGQPIYMLLGGADTYVGVEPCTTYAEALRANGARIEVKVYPGAGHGFDGGRAYANRRGENYSQCVSQQQFRRLVRRAQERRCDPYGRRQAGPGCHGRGARGLSHAGR